MNTFDEIKKLHKMLTDTNIPHTFGEFPIPIAVGYQIRIYSDAEMTNELDDAICHSGSHGYSRGLLETYVLGGCEGWETAEQVFKGWKKMYEKAKNNA